MMIGMMKSQEQENLTGLTSKCFQCNRTEIVLTVTDIDGEVRTYCYKHAPDLDSLVNRSFKKKYGMTINAMWRRLGGGI